MSLKSAHQILTWYPGSAAELDGALWASQPEAVICVWIPALGLQVSMSGRVCNKGSPPASCL